MRQSPRRLARLLLLAALLAVPPLPAAGQASSLGALDPYLLIGGDPPWTGALEGGAYRLTSQDTAGDVIYFVAALPQGAAQEIAVDLTVQGARGANYSGAGLIFNLDPATRQYLALVLTPNGELVVYRRDNQGLGELTRLPLAGTPPGAPLRLSLRVTADGLAIEANAVHQGSFQGLGLNGQAGILAIDGGDYRFANYAVK